MRKANVNGSVLALSTCAIYVGLSVLFLRYIAADRSIAKGLEATDSGGLFEYYVVTVSVIGAGLILVSVLYYSDKFWKNPAPEWLYAVLAVVLPFAIYFSIPHLPIAS